MIFITNSCQNHRISQITLCKWIMDAYKVWTRLGWSRLQSISWLVPNHISYYWIFIAIWVNYVNIIGRYTNYIKAIKCSAIILRNDAQLDWKVKLIHFATKSQEQYQIGTGLLHNPPNRSQIICYSWIPLCETILEVVADHRPEILIVGVDHRRSEDVGCNNIGLEVIRVNFNTLVKILRRLYGRYEWRVNESI
jgi:hypothetical protein